jgi:hypothetical protein
VLKTITEHPQGMTSAEITDELGRQGIGQQSIEHALGVLVRAKKSACRAAQPNTIPPQPMCRQRRISGVRNRCTR